MAVTAGQLRIHSSTFDCDFGIWKEISLRKWKKGPELIVSPNHDIFLAILLTTETLKVGINRKQIKDPISFYYKVSFIDRNGKEWFTKKGRKTNDRNPHFITLAEWNVDELNNVIGFDDNLILRCTLSIEDMSEKQDSTSLTNPFTESFRRNRAVVRVDAASNTDQIMESGGTDSMKFLTTLSSDLKKMYDNKTDSDIVLKTDDVEFPVHRTVLAARSEVFAAMFHHNTSERASGEANIVDVKTEILDSILQYVYSGKICGLTADTAVSMFLAADKYAFLELREHCLDFLLHNLTIENICDAALLAHTHVEESLENTVVGFINANIMEVMNSAEWQDFFAERPVIAGKLLQAALVKKHAKDSLKN